MYIKFNYNIRVASYSILRQNPGAQELVDYTGRSLSSKQCGAAGAIKSVQGIGSLAKDAYKRDVRESILCKLH